MARSSAGSTWRRQEQVNGCSPSGSGSRSRAGVPGWERGRAPASPEASAGRLTGPGSGRRPAPALARADLHLRGPEWRGNFACRPHRSRRSGGTEVPSRPRFPPAPSGSPLPVSAFFRQRRRLRAQCESSGRAGHVTRPRRRVGFPLETSTLRSARPRSPPQEAASARSPLPEEALPLCTLAVCCSSTFGLLRPLYSRLWVRLRRLSAPPTSQIPTSFSTV